MDFLLPRHLLIESNLMKNKKLLIMKTQPCIPKPVQNQTGCSESFDDLIFEGRNKSYGAFELKRKSRQYLLTGFLISFAGISTCIAVPFINALRNEGVPRELTRNVSVDIALIKPKSDVPLPPPPPDFKEIENIASSLAFKVVEEADEDIPLIPNEELFDKNVNKPVDLDPIPVPSDDVVIPDEDEDKIVLFPSEPASFMGGDLSVFRKWVTENIDYPAEAAGNGVFGKVFIEFCINSKGEVVDIKIIRSLHPSVDAETIRVISSSPKWTPAKQGGTPVKTKYIIPFVFDLI